MKSIAYNHHWNSELSQEQEMIKLFGTELDFENNADSYETNEAYLFQKGDKYFYLSANGCSCWDGDYDGWQFTKLELLKWAKENAANDYEDSDQLLAQWIMDNIK
jgi:hypothetical protein